MSNKIRIHLTHRQYTNGCEVVETNGNTVGDCINDLIHQFPAMKKVLFDDKGKVKRLIEFYLNSESTYPDELLKKVKQGDEITILVMLSGG